MLAFDGEEGGQDIMIKETDLDIIISELRIELDRIDRAIQVFERLALDKTTCRRRKPYRMGSVRFKRAGASPPAQYPGHPS